MKLKGSALVDYIIPIAIVGIVAGLGIYYLFANGNLLKFLASSGIIKVDKSNKLATVGGDLKTITYKGKDFDLTGGALGGTPDNPVKACTSDTCTIDFGEFILTDVPMQFENFVETAGTSGGTDKLLAMLDQLAAQMEAVNDMEGAAELKKFSNLGHTIAALESKMESIANQCASSSNPKLCFTNSYLKDGSLKNTSDINSQVSGLLENPAVFDSLKEYIASARPDLAQYETKYNKTKNLQTCAQSEVGCAFVNEFNTINNSSSYSGTVKALSTEIYADISKLCSNIAAMAEAMGLTETTVDTGYYITYRGGDCGILTKCRIPETETTTVNASPNQPVYDPFTGQPSTQNFSNKSIPDILHPKTSSVTHLDSKIVCISGKNEDNGYKCK